MTGFRVAHGGAAERYGITPDLVTLGKILGGGLPVGAYGGRADVMRHVAPLGPVYQAGTLSGNPLAMASGLATLAAIAPALYDTLEERAAGLEAAIVAAISKDIPARVQRVGSMLTVFFRREPVDNMADASACDTAAFARFHRALLEEGVLWPPSQFEAAFFGAAHGETEMDFLAKACQRALAAAIAAS